MQQNPLDEESQSLLSDCRTKKSVSNNNRQNINEIANSICKSTCITMHFNLQSLFAISIIFCLLLYISGYSPNSALTKSNKMPNLFTWPWGYFQNDKNVSDVHNNISAQNLNQQCSYIETNQCEGGLTKVTVDSEKGIWPKGLSWTLLKDAGEDISLKAVLISVDESKFKDCSNCDKFDVFLCLIGKYVLYTDSLVDTLSSVSICNENVAVGEALDFSTDAENCNSHFDMEHQYDYIERFGQTELDLDNLDFYSYQYNNVLGAPLLTSSPNYSPTQGINSDKDKNKNKKGSEKDKNKSDEDNNYNQINFPSDQPTEKPSVSKKEKKSDPSVSKKEKKSDKKHSHKDENKPDEDNNDSPIIEFNFPSEQPTEKPSVVDKEEKKSDKKHSHKDKNKSDENNNDNQPTENPTKKPNDTPTEKPIVDNNHATSPETNQDGSDKAGSDKVRIACVGDSITWGYGASTPSHSYPSVLGNLLGDKYLVRNFGVDGVTAQKISKN